MTNLEAWGWVERHQCSVKVDPRCISVYYRGVWHYSENSDIGMRIIECVQAIIMKEIKDNSL